jgi:uncharacterized membrane protein YdfJ with MMPL/SSD domain
MNPQYSRSQPGEATMDFGPVSGPMKEDIILEETPNLDDFYERFVKRSYFPFLQKYCRHVVGIWLVILIISAAFGPNFLNLMKSDLTLPAGTSSAIAGDALNSNYPDMSTWAPVFLVTHSTTSKGVISEFSRKVDSDLNKFVSDHSDVIQRKSGYFDYLSSPSLKFMIPNSLSADNKTIVTTLSFFKGTNLPGIQGVAEDCLKFADDRTTTDITVGCTGIYTLFQQISDESKHDLGTIDGIVLPIAIVILALNYQSYRHMLVALINLGCTLLLAFSLMIPVSQSININPFAASIMMSLVSG